MNFITFSTPWDPFLASFMWFVGQLEKSVSLFVSCLGVYGIVSMEYIVLGRMWL